MTFIVNLKTLLLTNHPENEYVNWIGFRVYITESQCAYYFKNMFEDHSPVSYIRFVICFKHSPIPHSKQLTFCFAMFESKRLEEESQ